MNLRKSLYTLALFLTPAVAFAHTGHDHAGLMAGLAHPVFGLDHLLAMRVDHPHELPRRHAGCGTAARGDGDQPRNGQRGLHGSALLVDMPVHKQVRRQAMRRLQRRRMRIAVPGLSAPAWRWPSWRAPLRRTADAYG